MIKEIEALFNEKILSEVANRYGIKSDQLKSMGGFESYVYEYELMGEKFILKITHSMRRSINYISGEIDWLNYLADQGLSVSKAVLSKNHNLVECIPAQNESDFLAISYLKAAGCPVAAEHWNAQLFEQWGRLMGATHKLTKSYKLSNPLFKRQEWFEEDQINIQKYVPQSHKLVYEKTTNLFNRLHSLPKNKNTYGLVHSDLHQKNFFVEEGTITAFDFDDIQYNWFANDIAIVLYYALWLPPVSQEKTEFTKYFLHHFLNGYSRENSLESKWLISFPDFLQLRHVLLFVIQHQMWDVHNLNTKQQEIYDNHQEDIVLERPVIDFNFSLI